jgi:hypothetical protein
MRGSAKDKKNERRKNKRKKKNERVTFESIKRKEQKQMMS